MDLKQGAATDDPAAIADLIWETDPEMCRFVFSDRRTWHRCCSDEWIAAIGLHASGSAIVARHGDEIAGLLIAFPQSEMAERCAATVGRYESDIGQRMETVGWLFPMLPEKTLYVFESRSFAAAPGKRYWAPASVRSGEAGKGIGPDRRAS